MYEHFVRFGKIENRQREVSWEKYFCFFIILVGEYEYEIKHLIFINSDKNRHQYICRSQNDLISIGIFIDRFY